MNKSIAITAALSVALLLGGCTKTPPVEAGKEFGNQLGAVKYLIKPGDNLVLIASEQTLASENWRRLADFNRIENPASIKVGQTIWIPNDLIPLNTSEVETREIAGHPDAVVNSVELPAKVYPISR